MNEELFKTIKARGVIKITKGKSQSNMRIKKQRRYVINIFHWFTECVSILLLQGFQDYKTISLILTENYYSFPLLCGIF